MRCPEGSELLEYVALSFGAEALVADLVGIFDHYEFVVSVNDKPIAAANLWHMPEEPRESGRYVFRIGYQVKEGDEVTAQLKRRHFGDWIVQTPGGLTINSELSITGQVEIETR